jgi:hypothetical protein
MQMIVGLDIWSRLKNSDWAREVAPLLRFDKKYANQPLHRSPLCSAGELFIGESQAKTRPLFDLVFPLQAVKVVAADFKGGYASGCVLDPDSVQRSAFA